MPVSRLHRGCHRHPVERADGVWLRAATHIHALRRSTGRRRRFSRGWIMLAQSGNADAAQWLAQVVLVFQKCNINAVIMLSSACD
jgi:hypothetical protein